MPPMWLLWLFYIKWPKGIFAYAVKIANLLVGRKRHRLSGRNLISCLNGRAFSQLVSEVRFEAWKGFSPSLLAGRWRWPCDQECSWPIKSEGGTNNLKGNQDVNLTTTKIWILPTIWMRLDVDAFRYKLYQ